MRARTNATAIYLVCFHSAKPDTLRDSKGQYRIVETAIRDAEWLYDNGDDPSFYVARRGGPLTWGVCRQDLRNSLAKDSIVVFFSFTPLKNDEILYRLCAVETVIDRVDHRSLHRDQRFAQFRHLYINGLIIPENDGWRYAETDRRTSQRHKDWLWRMADHRGSTREQFGKKHASVCRDEWFADNAVGSGTLRLGSNYVVFSIPPDRAFISPRPPKVAIARNGQHEQWTDKTLQAITVGAAAVRDGRGYLRVVNPSGRNVHRQIKFHMPAEEARKWRDELIAALSNAAIGE